MQSQTTRRFLLVALMPKTWPVQGTSVGFVVLPFQLLVICKVEISEPKILAQKSEDRAPSVIASNDRNHGDDHAPK